MNVFFVITVIVGIFSVAEAAAADTCDQCTTTFANSDDCTNIKTYISCLIDTYQNDATKTGCDTIKTKMDVAKTKYDTNCGSDPVTKSCICEIDFYKSATLDCAAIKAKLTCLFVATGVGCDDSTTKISLVSAAKTAGKLKTDCITDSCECEAIYAESDVSDEPKKCIALKTQLNCLDSATGLSCDGTKGADKLAVAADGLIEDKTSSNCRTDLSDACICQITYAKIDVTAVADKCTALKKKMNCLDIATGLGCDGTKRADELAVAADLLIEDKTPSNCRTDLSDACICQITYAKTDVTAAADKCTALQKKMHCLDAATAVGCDATSTSQMLAVKTNKLIVDVDGLNCKTDRTDTCSCQIEYAIVDVSVEATKCTELKKKMHCLAKADGVGCDGTSSRSAIATSADKLIGNDCKSDLTKTCKCAINYAKTDATTTAEKCKAATVVQECLTNITDTTDKACDDTTLVGLYLNETMVPKVTTLCNDAASLNGVGLALGILLMFQEMVRQI